MERNENRMEENDSNNDDKPKEDELPFGGKKNVVSILDALFKHGRGNLPFSVIPGMSVTECQSAMDSALGSTETVVKNKPSIINWLRGGLFEANECNVPLALLFIALYEQHPVPYDKNVECDFRELYHFLHKVTTNQPVPHLSHNSSVVLHKLLSELLDEVWPNLQPELLKYISTIHFYSRPPVRRTYSRKRTTLDKETAENCSS